jgi:cob(I)alamin adenosyltransferase
VLPPLTHFILPGGHPFVSYAHLARTVCRRAERIVVALADHDQVNPLIIQYLNRLSDYLFILARFIAHSLNVEENKWIPKTSKNQE